MGTSTSGNLSAELLAKIEANRAAAIERKRKRDEEDERVNKQKIQESAQLIDWVQARADTENDADADAHVAIRTLRNNVRANVGAAKPPGERTGKQELVAAFLCRWWYVMPPWPPPNHDYTAELHRCGLRVEAVEAFHTVPEVDEHGRRKVYQLASFPGLFRDEQGCLIDLRPIEGRPSYDQMMLKSTPELHRLLVQALENQLKALEGALGGGELGPADEEKLRSLRKTLAEARQKAAFAFMFKPKKT